METRFKMNPDPETTDYKKYLKDLDDYMKRSGYKKYDQNYKNETYAYWKTFGENYQIGVLVYDWHKFRSHSHKKKVSISYECMLNKRDYRCDMSVSKDIDLPEFEKMAKKFYTSMKDD